MKILLLFTLGKFKNLKIHCGELDRRLPTLRSREVKVPGQTIDRYKLRTAIRSLDNQYVYYMLDQAIDLLPQAKLVKLVKSFLDPAKLRPDSKSKGSLLADVKAFEETSLRGEYYESFDVNYKNCTEISKGTRAWIAECRRLLDRCVEQASKGKHAETRKAMEILFGLLHRIDEGPDDFIFFADEGGSWLVGIDWAKVLPAWFVCISATAGPDEYARRVVEVVDEFEKHNRRKHLFAARRAATQQQYKAFSASKKADQ